MKSTFVSTKSTSFQDIFDLTTSKYTYTEKITPEGGTLEVDTPGAHKGNLEATYSHGRLALKWRRGDREETRTFDLSEGYDVAEVKTEYGVTTVGLVQAASKRLVVG